MADNIQIHQNSTDPNDPNSPGIVAYRVGELEKAVSAGFKTVTNQIQEITKGFVEKNIYEAAVREGKQEHEDLRKEIDKLWNVVGWVVKTVIGAVLLAAIAALIAL